MNNFIRQNKIIGRTVLVMVIFGIIFSTMLEFIHQKTSPIILKSEAIAKEKRSGIESVCETLNPQDFKINLEDRFEIAFKDKALRDEVETNFKLPKHLHFARSEKGGSLFF